jgi:hypothetical protein
MPLQAMAVETMPYHSGHMFRYFIILVLIGGDREALVLQVDGVILLVVVTSPEFKNG